MAEEEITQKITSEQALQILAASELKKEQDLQVYNQQMEQRNKTLNIIRLVSLCGVSVAVAFFLASFYGNNQMFWDNLGGVNPTSLKLAIGYRYPVAAYVFYGPAYLLPKCFFAAINSGCNTVEAEGYTWTQILEAMELFLNNNAKESLTILQVVAATVPGCSGITSVVNHESPLDELWNGFIDYGLPLLSAFGILFMAA